MTLEWIDPPRDYRDDAADIAQQLHNNPGTWARIREGESYQTSSRPLRPRTKGGLIWQHAPTIANAPTDSTTLPAPTPATAAGAKANETASNTAGTTTPTRTKARPE